MSKDSTLIVEKSRFAIVNEVAALLNLGDFGKVESFVRKTIKKLEREIETADRSIINLKHNAEQELSLLNDKLEDAQQSAKEAYTNLDPKNLATNEAQRNHIEVYLGNAQTAEENVLNVEQEIEAAKKCTAEAIKHLEEEISTRKVIISKVARKAKK